MDYVFSSMRADWGGKTHAKMLALNVVCLPLSGVYTSNLFKDLDFYLGQILSLYEAKGLGKYLAQIFSFIKRRLHNQFLKRFGILFGPNIVPL